MNCTATLCLDAPGGGWSWPGRRINTCESGHANQGQGCLVVVGRAVSGEVADVIQNGDADILSRIGWRVLKSLFDADQAEFFFGLIMMTAAFDHSARNQQQRSTFLDGDGRCIAGGVGKEP